MFDQVKTDLQKANPDYTLCLPDLYCYYEMSLISFGCDKDFNYLLQLNVFIELHTQKLWSVPIKDNSTEKKVLHLTAALKRLCGYERGKFYFLDNIRINIMRTHGNE